MNIGIITYNKNPYRQMQFNKFSEIEGCNINVYYCKRIDREWKVKEKCTFKEEVLENESYLFFKLLKIINENEYIVLGGYDQKIYILLSIICKIKRKKYSIIFDGISTNKLKQNKKSLKYRVKKFVINNATSIFGNGTVSKVYFKENFNKTDENIFNQYLTIDGEYLKQCKKRREEYRKYYRKKYNIQEKKKVIMFSGRLIAEKNIEAIVEGIALMQNKNEIIFFIAGGGPLEEKIRKLASKLEVDIRITGFIKEQKELFKHYFLADVFTIMSLSEAWGLVINEAMYAGLPVIVSGICGASLDLVKNGVNGFKIDRPEDYIEIKNFFEAIWDENLNLLGKASFEMIEKWSFDNSKKEFEKMLKYSKEK